MLQQDIGFIGAGQMARALASGFVKSGLLPARQLLAADPSPAALQSFSEALPEARIVDGNVDVATQSDVLILAIKPQQMGAVLKQIRPVVGTHRLVISIAAGVRLATLAAGLAEGVRLVRVMPNTPCLVGQCAAGYCLGPNTTPSDGELVAKLLGAVGVAFPLDEKLLDAVTGLSGSGPAFVYVVIEALADGGVRMGLPRDVAQALAAQTLRGAAEMVLATGEHPAMLKDRVASPGGTTIAGLEALEAAGVRGALIAAVIAATQRASELGNG